MFYNQLFNSNLFLVGTLIAHVKPNTDFRILIGNVMKHPQTLTIGQNVYVAEHNPTSIIIFPIKHGEVFAVAVKKLYRKLPFDAKIE